MSAPIFSANSRRPAEKSAATIGPDAFRVSMTAIPTGPHPTTKATSPGAMFAAETA